jgi:ribosomal protein L3 glutamine methyltransferase
MRARAPSTVGQYFRLTSDKLTKAKLHYGHGTRSARDEAAYLILHTLGLPLDSIGRYLERRITTTERKRLDSLLARRIALRMPSAYLTHEAWLGDLSFYVDRRVIVPRSFVSELLRERMQPWLRAQPKRILDLCTGSGCLAIVAAQAFPKARIDAADVSAAALAVARRNVDRYRLRSRVHLVKSDLFAKLGDARYDLILCNPPYVTSRSMRALPPEHRHEPRIALAGGVDGLDIVRRILGDAAGHLSPRGLLVCEIGHNRHALESAYPEIAFTWPELSTGPGNVFLIDRVELTAARGLQRDQSRGR